MVPNPGATTLPGRPSSERLPRAGLLSSSPAKLRAATTVTVVCALLLCLGGWWSIEQRAGAIDDAAAAARQLIRVQDVRVRVVEADSLASRAYLEGGQEDPEQRAAYDERVAAAANGLVEASNGASAADSVLLQQASSRLATYVGLVEQARANNRQGFPVGAAYQRQARTISVAIVEDLRNVEANARAAVDDRMARGHRASALFVASALVLVAVLAAGSVWMAVRWRRLINVPLAIAGVIAVLVVVLGGSINASAIEDADAVVEGSLSSADLLAQARAAAFDARSNEALTLVYRGNGAPFAEAWERSRSVVDSALDASCGEFGDGCDAQERWDTYTDGYDSVRALDTGGDWDSAVALSTTGQSPNATEPAVDPVAPFDEFATSTAGVIEARIAVAEEGFADAGERLGALAAGVVLAGVAVALLATAGYGQRLREYR